MTIETIANLIYPSVLLIIGAAAGFVFNHWTQRITRSFEKRKALLDSLEEIDCLAEKVKKWADFKAEGYWSLYTCEPTVEKNAPECPINDLCRLAKYHVIELNGVTTEYAESVEAIRTGIRIKIDKVEDEGTFDYLDETSYEYEHRWYNNKWLDELLTTTFGHFEKSHEALLASVDKLNHKYNKPK